MIVCMCVLRTRERLFMSLFSCLSVFVYVFVIILNAMSHDSNDKIRQM